MEYRMLGKTGLNVSALGFGGIPIQRVDPSRTRILLNRLMEIGVNFIDTARGYSVSEAYLGEALEGIRQHFILATKSMARDASSMSKDIEESLRNLKTDYIDLYQVHNPSLNQLEQITAPGGALEALLSAKAAGKIKHIGLTAHSSDVFQKALTLDWVESIMFPYNIVETHGESLIAECHRNNVGFIAMKPLAGGAIDDPQLAIRFIHGNPNVSVIIPGMADISEVEQNYAAISADPSFSTEEYTKLEKIRNDLGTHFCRRCGYCAPCSVGIDIPTVFVLQGYLERYGLSDWAKIRYQAQKKNASDCIGCGICETRCPYQLPIREMLSKTAKAFQD